MSGLDSSRVGHKTLASGTPPCPIFAALGGEAAFFLFVICCCHSKAPVPPMLRRALAIAAIAVLFTVPRADAETTPAGGWTPVVDQIRPHRPRLHKPRQPRLRRCMRRQSCTLQRPRRRRCSRLSRMLPCLSPPLSLLRLSPRQPLPQNSRNPLRQRRSLLLHPRRLRHQRLPPEVTSTITSVVGADGRRRKNAVDDQRTSTPIWVGCATISTA